MDVWEYNCSCIWLRNLYPCLALVVSLLTAHRHEQEQTWPVCWFKGVLDEGCVGGGQAHKVGSVTALCRTPWGELWTGSSRGSVRVWDIARLDALSEPGELLPRELRRNGGQRPHAGKVSHIICPPGGQVPSPMKHSHYSMFQAVKIPAALFLLIFGNLRISSRLPDICSLEFTMSGVVCKQMCKVTRGCTGFSSVPIVFFLQPTLAN